MSGRGGARRGAGRKPLGFLRPVDDSPMQVAVAKISERLPWLVDQLLILAEGVEIRGTDRHGQLRVYTQAPDRAAIEYLMDRVMGKPAQPVGLDIVREAEQLAAQHGVDPAKVISIFERMKKTG